MVRSLALIAAASLAISASTSTVAAWEVLALNATNPMHEPARRLALSCALQQNVDFVGNDLTSVAGGAPGDCCAKCAATARCTAFTWSNFNGGTCWLKTGKGTTKTMAGVVSAEVKQDATATCAVENNVDYIGNDVGNAVAGVTECCTRCQSVARCTAYTWSNHNGGTCWFKSSKGATKVTTGVVSGVVSTTPATCSNEKDVDYIGNDIKNVVGSSDSCCDQCSKTLGCNAFTWSSYNGGVCYLKSSKGATKPGTGLVSGVIGATPTPTTPAPTTPTPTTPAPTTPAPTTPKPTTPAPTTPAPTTPAPTTPKPTTPAPGQCVVEKDVDYIANDLTNVPGPADSCCAACTKVAGCKAYTWSSYNGGVCYLKSGKGATKVGAGLISGYVGTTPTPTTPAPTTPTPSTPTPTTPAPGQQCTIERGLDYVGNDLTNVPGADASACCSKCLDVPSCNAFSWSAGVCYLKTGKGATTASLTVDSGIVSRPPPTNSCQISENTNIVGLDIANFPRQAADDCCAVCASYSGCGAFTWTNFNGGTCWLKSDFGKTTTVTGSHSGRVTVANPPRTHIQYALRSRSVRIKSVNLGNWLATEYWLWYESPAYTGVWNIGNQGEYAVMRERTNRGDRAAALAGFETHRKQWITEADIRDIAASGINSVRVPVGFWIIGDDASVTKNNDMNMFAPGALKYLDVLINEWAVKYNVAVMLSLHAHMGSQNGYDHSAPYALNTVRWGWGEPYQNSVQFATFLAARYKRSPAFLGMNMMNEPASTVDMNAVFSYYKEVYRIVRADGNDCILVTSPHLGDQGAYANRDFMTTGYYNVWHEFHIYFKWGAYDGMAEWQILDAARNYRKNNLAGWPGNPLYIGEWALATPTSGGRFNDINKLRELATIQMDQFQGSTAGWAFWNYKHNDEAKNIDARGWSFRYMRQLGVLPNLY